MTREERIKYCRCCINRRSAPSCGLVCSLTGRPADFEDGCRAFDEDPIAIKEHYYAEEERKNARFASIENLIIGLAVCCFIIPYVVSVADVAIEGEYSLFWRMLIVSGSFALIGGIMIWLLHLSRRHRKQMQKHSNVLSGKEILRVIREEGYFPANDSEEGISFKINGTRIEVGECADGFVYTRIYYKIDKEELQNALLAANQVEKKYVAIKVMVFPEEDILLFSVESYCRDIEMYREFFRRSIAILSDSKDKFREQIQECIEQEYPPATIISEDSETLDQSKILS